MGLQKTIFWILRCFESSGCWKEQNGSILQTIFPEGIHKLNPQDIAQAEDYLEKAFSDDVSATVIFPMIEAEDINPTFNHPKT